MNVCTECFNNSNFSFYIENNGDYGQCDFDEFHKDNYRVLSVEAISKYVDQYFKDNYQISEEYPVISSETDRVFYEDDGELYEDILRNDLEIDENVLQAIIEKLPYSDPHSIAKGEVPFYDESKYYEPKGEVNQYYEIDAALSNSGQFGNLDNNLFQLTELLDKTDELPTDIQKFQLMMIFSFCITSLESYLSDTFAQTVFKDEKYKKKYVSTEPYFKEINIPFSKIFDNFDKIDEIIKNRIQETTFHSLGKVKKLYEATFDIKIGDISELAKLTTKRHDFVHRRGKNKSGEEVTTNKEEIFILILLIRNLCLKIETEIQKLFAEDFPILNFGIGEIDLEDIPF